MAEEQQDKPEASEPDVDENGDCKVCNNERGLCSCTRCEFCAAVANEENWRVCGGCMHTFQRYWDAENGFARTRVAELEQQNTALKKANDDFAAAILVLPGGTRRDAINTAVQMCKDWHTMRSALRGMLRARACEDEAGVPTSELTKAAAHKGRAALAATKWWDENGVVAASSDAEPNARCETCADPVYCPSCAADDGNAGRQAFAVPIGSGGEVGLQHMKPGDACAVCGWQLHEHFSGNLACDKCGTHFQPIKNETR